MAELENDVIAGIGDRPTGSNVIYPYFDAHIRKFIIGKDCILSGLELSSDGLRLTAGYCCGEGFVGKLKSDIVFNAVPSKIYGRFIVNHAETYTTEDDLDYFYIVSDPVAGVRQDDILNEKGEYWLLLYDNKRLVVDRNYPENAVNSDTSTRLIENGTIAANAEVEGDTKSSDTSDKTVASTAWVQKIVEKQINAGAVELTIGTTKITLKRKAKLVIGTAIMPDNKIDWTVTGNLPAGFTPKETFSFIVWYQSSSTYFIRRIEFNRSGAITVSNIAEEARITGINFGDNTVYIGYEVE